MKICRNCTQAQAIQDELSLFIYWNRFGEMDQWILCSEWVPSEWESKLLIKTSGKTLETLLKR